MRLLRNSGNQICIASKTQYPIVAWGFELLNYEEIELIFFMLLWILKIIEKIFKNFPNTRKTIKHFMILKINIFSTFVIKFKQK